MTSPERPSVDSTVQLAHVHDTGSVPMTQADIDEERVGLRDSSERVGRWAFFECAECGTQVAFRFGN
jgi:hypothetical protein